MSIVIEVPLTIVSDHLPACLTARLPTGVAACPCACPPVFLFIRLPARTPGRLPSGSPLRFQPPPRRSRPRAPILKTLSDQAIMSSLQDRMQARLNTVRTRISVAAQAAGRRTDEVTLLAVSKAFGADAVLAAIAAGQRSFGENYLQEAVEKMGEVARRLPGQRVSWHFIGPLQSNKTRQVATQFDWVESVDRLKIAERLSEQRPAHLPPLQVLLQVNISGEATKGGVAPAEVEALALAVAGLPGLRLRGLMAIPAPESDPTRRRQPFAQVRALFERLHGRLGEHPREWPDGQPGKRPNEPAGEAGPTVDTLSMGMSGDLEAAIAEGATQVRVGTAIFGERS
jgi:hypothetical protein